MSDRVRLRLAFDVVEYDGSLLDKPAHESAPVFMCWSSLPGRAKNYFPIRWRAGSHGTKSQPFAAHTDFAVPAQSYDRLTHTAVIEPGDTLGVRVKAHTPNASGVLSLQNCGDTLVPLGTLLGGALRDANDDVKRANRALSERELPLALKFHVYSDDRSGERVTKGALLLSGLRIQLADEPDLDVLLDLRRDADSGEVAAPSEFAYVSANQRLFGALVEDIMVRSILMFTEDATAQGFGFAPSSDESRRVHAPFFALPSGMLPGFVYCMRPGPLAPAAERDADQFDRVQSWLRMLADCALERANRRADWFIETVDAQLERRDNAYDDAMTDAADLLGQMLAAAPTSLPYVSDEVRTAARARLARVRTKNGYIEFRASPDGAGVHAVERFSEEADNDGGDCEDGGMFAYRIATTLAHGDWDDELVAAMAALARQYVPTVNLGSVKDASVSNDLTDESQLRNAKIIDSPIDRKQSYGAHMWCEMVPLAKFVAQVRRAVPDVRSELLWLRGAVRAPWIAALPHLVIEATGRLGSLQLPRIAYVMNDDADSSKKRALVAAREAHRRTVAHLVRASPVFRQMQMVREQADTHNTPNKRPTNFYRQTTHTFTAAFMENGLATVDFVAAHRGKRVPAPANGDLWFADNQVAAAMRAPGGDDGEFAAAAAAATDKTDDAEDDDAAAMAKIASEHAENSAFQLKPTLDVESVGTALDRAAAAIGLVAGASVPDRNKDTEFLYGVPLYDRLQPQLLPATCLVPNTPLSAREMRVVAELMRHAPPITMPGDWDKLAPMHEAALDSRAAVGQDERAARVTEDDMFDTLRAEVRSAMGTLDETNGTVVREWPKRVRDGRYTLVTFFFPAAWMRQANAPAAIADAVRAQRRAGVCKYARVAVEELMPGRRFGRLQMLCNAPAEH